ncbi:lipid II:glycine glycyltransferase FemX [Methylobacterium nodulans]|uniref:Methicillin resistance protein n=1 Tax=Methylobacterium nodulans (strain LMG 21967 / CNCM I-2342 / ORS 2060) TaxID=460265 RepID=B8IXA0_METNO|nr:peptidoglycan bridge formation glycyltransferase FemA/FemB family protein [Methylobacterium nodulans]ACL63141.1 Methicillin resistance protein [Methylobacterium nodulans ORS 2060]
MSAEVAVKQPHSEFDRWKTWDAFIEQRADPGFRQLSWYTSLQVARGWEQFGTVLRYGDAIIGGAMVLARSFAPGKCYYIVPDGPIFLEEDSPSEQEQVFRTVMSFIERKRQTEQRVVSHLCINPRWEHVPEFVTGFRKSSHYYGTPRDTLYIDLTSSESAILAQMKPKGRYNIRVAQRYGVSVVEDVSSKGIEDFLAVYRETFDRRRKDGRSSGYFHNLIPRLLAADRGSIFFSEYQGTRIATALVVYSGRMATYYYGGSRDVHRNVMAPYLLHFEIMRTAKSRGCLSYDLFGVTPQGAPSDGWQNFSIFKRKFGGREVRFVPTLEHIYDPAAYQEWKEAEDE